VTEQCQGIGTKLSGCPAHSHFGFAHTLSGGIHHAQA
jgi:hypothetical protein